MNDASLIGLVFGALIGYLASGLIILAWIKCLDWRDDRRAAKRNAAWLADYRGKNPPWLCE